METAFLTTLQKRRTILDYTPKKSLIRGSAHVSTLNPLTAQV